MRKHIILLLPLAILGVSSAQATPSVATAEYVQEIVNALGVPEISNKLAQHIGSTDNPHAVTAEQVGLGNVKNVDSTNADNMRACQWVQPQARLHRARTAALIRCQRQSQPAMSPRGASMFGLTKTGK